MMVNRRHPKKTPAFAKTAACELKVANLNHYGGGLSHKNPAYDYERERLLNHEGDHPNQSAEGERPCVSHEDFCWKRIVPKKGHPCPHDRPADHREFARPWHMADQQIIANAHVARRIRHDPIHQRDRDRTTDRKSVEP